MNNVEILPLIFNLIENFLTHLMTPLNVPRLLGPITVFKNQLNPT